MSYIGNTSTTQAFTPAIDYFSGNGSTTAFTLSRPVASVAQVQVVIDNVAQNPSSAYTVSGSTITFTSAPLSGTNNIYVYYTSPITQVIAPGQGTVNTTALGNITNIASGNSSLTLQTGASNTTAVTVDTSQNVGIGTTSPTSQNGKVLQIDGGAGAADFRLTNNATGTAKDNGILLGLAGSDAYLYNFENAFMAFGTNATERMRIDSSGNVGIGTSTIPSTFSGGLVVNGAVSLGSAAAQNGNFTVGANVYWITMYSLTGTTTITLPTPATNTGRQLWIRVQSNQAVNSASSNVTTLAGGGTTNSILTATAGKWAFLICDGAYWNIVAAN
jgi:hypothetical protein